MKKSTTKFHQNICKYYLECLPQINKEATTGEIITGTNSTTRNIT